MTEVAEAHRDLPDERLGVLLDGWLRQHRRDDELCDGECECGPEHDAEVERAEHAAEQHAEGCRHEADRADDRLPPRVGVGSVECFERVVVECDVGSGQRCEAAGEEELTEHDHHEPLVSDQETHVGDDPTEGCDAQREGASEPVAHPAGGDLEDDDEQVVQRGQQEGAVEVESSPCEQHHDRQPHERVGERLVDRDQPEIALERRCPFVARGHASILTVDCRTRTTGRVRQSISC